MSETIQLCGDTCPLWPLLKREDGAALAAEAIAWAESPPSAHEDIRHPDFPRVGMVEQDLAVRCLFRHCNP